MVPTILIMIVKELKGAIYFSTEKAAHYRWSKFIQLVVRIQYYEYIITYVITYVNTIMITF